MNIKYLVLFGSKYIIVSDSKRSVSFRNNCTVYKLGIMFKHLNAEMPLEWLKEQIPLDYETEVREYLNDNCRKEIKKLGWKKDL